MDALSLQKYLSEQAKFEASVFAESVQNNNFVRVITYALDTAVLETDPKPVGFAFSSFYVFSATDTGSSINMRLGTKDSFQDKITLSRDTQLAFPFPVPNAYIDWTAQSGKSISVIYLLKGQFNLNRIQFTQSLSTIDGTSGTLRTNAALSITTTASVLLAADGTRNIETIANLDPTTDIYVGDSNVTDPAGAYPGIPLRAGGGSMDWRNTGALYGICSAGMGPVKLISRFKQG